MLMVYSFGCLSTNHNMHRVKYHHLYIERKSLIQDYTLMAGIWRQAQAGSNQSIAVQICKKCKAGKSTTEFLNFATKTPAQANGCEHNACLTCWENQAYANQKKI